MREPTQEDLSQMGRRYSGVMGRFGTVETRTWTTAWRAWKAWKRQSRIELATAQPSLLPPRLHHLLHHRQHHREQRLHHRLHHRQHHRQLVGASPADDGPEVVEFLGIAADMGFAESRARSALSRMGGDTEAALEELLAQG